MENFIFFDEKTKAKYLNPRKGETKFGEKLSAVNALAALENSPAQYVILGVPEDIGIRANYGIAGASTTWDSFLAAFLNIQSNEHNHPENCLILGQLDCSDWMDKAQKRSEENGQYPKNLGPLVEQIDTELSALVQAIVQAGKTPIIIGGGHNNAYPNIKGTSKALQRPIAVLNIDAHTDLRRMDYRHSGNGFSYARAEGYLKEYTLFGIHKNYTPQYIFDHYAEDSDTKIVLYEDLLHLPTHQLLAEFEIATNFPTGQFGLEIDCDVIENFSSSAMTPSGFALAEIRNFIRVAKKSDLHYLHLAEASAKGNAQIGKALSYLVSDFIRK